MTLDILNRQRKVQIDVAKLRPRLEAAIRAATSNEVSVTLVFVSNAAIRRLNFDWRYIDEPTDVLSFPAREGEGADYAGDHLGDVVISLERAMEQGPIHVPKAAPVEALEKEVVFLFVHGLCHLLGHDHDEPTAARRMKALEKRIFDRIP